jgi:hypothetical protein
MFQFWSLCMCLARHEERDAIREFGDQYRNTWHSCPVSFRDLDTAITVQAVASAAIKRSVSWELSHTFVWGLLFMFMMRFGCGARYGAP